MRLRIVLLVGGGGEDRNPIVDQESTREAPPASGDRIGQAIQTPTNIMEERERNNNAPL
jgi:hypothetical protein